MKQAILFLAVFFVLIGGASAALNDGLLFYYTMDNAQTSGTTITDLSANNLDGTITSTNPTTGVAGYINQAYDYSGGTVGYVRPNEWQLTGAAGTLAAWCKTDTTAAGDRYCFANRETGATGRIYIGQQGGVFFARLNSTSRTYGTVNTGTWYHIALTWNVTGQARVYINGTYISALSGAFTPTDLEVNNNMTTGMYGVSGSTGLWNGAIDEWAGWARNLSDAEIADLYAQTDHNFVTGAVSPVTLSATNRYTTASLTNFSTIFNGTQYNTTNGTIVLPLLTSTTQLWNLTYISLQNGGYFNRTYNNLNLTGGSHSGSLHQAELTLYAANRVTGAEVTSFTASTSSNGGSATATGTNPRLNLTAGNDYTITFAKNNYYASTITGINLSALENTTANFSEVYNHVLNVTITTYGSSTDQNFTINLYNQDTTYTETASTTNGYIEFNITQGNWSVWLNDSIHSLENSNITLNNTDNYTAISIVALTANTFNITFYNETTNDLLDNINITWQIISALETRNGTTSNGTALEELLTPSDYEIRYWIVEDVPRSYYVTLSNQSSENIRLYIVDEDISAWYIAIVEDTNAAKCSNQTVGLLRYYIDVNSYRIVDMARTDTNGQAVLRVIPNYQPYKLTFEGSCGDFVSEPSQLIDTSNTYTVTNAQSVLTSTYLDANTGLTYTNATRTFSYTWSDTTNVVTGACLQITRLAGGVRSVEDLSCTDGASGSIIYTINASNANNSIYYATGYLETNTEYSEPITNTLEISFFDNTTLKGVVPFVVSLILATLILAGSYSAVSLMAMLLLGLVLVTWIGFTGLSWITITSFAILILVVIYRIRR